MTIDYVKARLQAQERIEAWLTLLSMQERAMRNDRIAAAVRARARAAAPAVAFAAEAAREVTRTHDALALARLEARNATAAAAGARRAAWRAARVAFALRCPCCAQAALRAIDHALALGAAARDARARARDAAAAFAAACAESEQWRCEAAALLFGGWTAPAADDAPAHAAEGAAEPKVSTDALIAAVYSAAAPAIRAMRPRPRASQASQASQAQA